jgi:hypothetical protein
MASFIGLLAGVAASLALLGPLGTLALIGFCEVVHLVLREDRDE